MTRLGAVVLCMGLAGCGRPAPEAVRERPVGEHSVARLRVASPAFAAGGGIPAQYTCQGQDTPPPLSWEAGPAGTVSYALVVEDPDAPRGTWVPGWSGTSPAPRCPRPS